LPMVFSVDSSVKPNRNIQYRPAKFSAPDKLIEDCQVAEFSQNEPTAVQGKVVMVYAQQLFVGIETEEDFSEKLCGTVKDFARGGALGLVIVNDFDDSLDELEGPEGYSAEIPVVMVRGADAGRLIEVGNSSCLVPWKDPCLMTLTGHRYSLLPASAFV